MTYQDARSFLDKGRNKTRRPLSGRVSQMIAREDCIAVQYQATDVVRFYPNGTVILNTDGWRTVTTKERINQYSPVNVYQRNGLWYMPDGSLFYDGIKVKSDGTVIQPRKAGKTESAKRKIDKLVSSYVTAFRKQIEHDGKLPVPDNGDCWYCSMIVSSPKPQKGKTPGDANGDVSHILSHLQEKYIFGSILWNAVQRRGNPSFCWQYGNSYAEKGDGSFLMDDLRYYLRTRKHALTEALGN